MNIDINGVQITLTDEQLKHIDTELKKKENQQSAEYFFLEMYNGCIIKFDFSKSDSIFLLKNNEVLFEQDLTNGYFWCDYTKVWLFFKSKYGMNCQQIEVFIKDILERRLKLGSLIPYLTTDYRLSIWESVSNWGL